MARRLDVVLVVDVESTCWEGAPPRGQDNEIIEIGVCLLEVSSGKRRDKVSILVRPEHSKVSAFCTSLTTLTQEQVDSGISFQDACMKLKHDFNSPNRLWASYGDYDRRMFERQCHTRHLAYPFGPSHLNIKSLFALTNGLTHEVGMAQALEVAGLSLEGTHHRGGDDAWNIAGLLSHLLTAARRGVGLKGID